MADEWDALPNAPTVTASPSPAQDEWDKLPDAAPAASEPTGGPGFIDSVKDSVAPVLNAFGQGFNEGWGPDRWGMSRENQKWLASVGIYQKEGERYANPFHAFNELLIETLARTAELGSRGLPAIYRGAQAAGIEAGLPRDIVSLPDAFMGSPHPTGMPGARVAETTRAATIDELGQRGNIEVRPTPPEVRATEPEVTQPIIEARRLGVVGPEPPRLSDAPPREAAAAATRSGDDILRGPEPGKGEAPSPANAWEDRFNKFVGKLDTAEDVKGFIRDAARDNDNFQAARTGDVPLAHVDAMAEAAGVEPGMIDREGLGRLAKSDAEMRVAMQTMLTMTENVRDAARDVKTDASEPNLIKLQEAIMRRDLAVEQVVARRAEWGRTGNVIQEFQRRTKEENGLSDFLKERGRTPDDLKDIANALDDLDNTGAARVLSNAHQNMPGKFYWTWVNGLISGMLTHTKYVAANALYAATEHGIVTPLAAVIGKAKQVLGADVDRVYFGEGAAATWGFISAVPDAVIATGKSIYSGQRAVLKSEIELHKDAIARGEKVSPIIDRAVNQISGQARPIDGVWGRIIGAPGDVAMGIHTFFKILGERAALRAEAYRAAVNEGLSPADADFWRRHGELSQNPSIEMMDRAVASAYKGTFMNELGPKGKDWQRFSKGNPVLKWIFPFAHIPLNLMKATYEATPAAFLDAEMRSTLKGEKGGVAQDKAIARMVVGSAIMGYFVQQALNGRVTGDYPTDPKERDAWKLAGKQPNSILIGGYWVSFDKFGPAGSLANLGANFGSVIPHIGDWWTGKDDEGMSTATWHAAHAAGNLVVNEVGFLSLKMLFEAMQEERKGAAWVASTTGSLLPFSSAIGQTASGGLPFTGGTFGDPYMRDAKTFIDGLKYRIPGLRETLLPKRDFFGEPLPNPQYGNIIRQRLATTDPVLLEMERLQIHPGPPTDRIGGVKLTPKLYDEYQVLAGTAAKMMLEPVVNSAGWSQVPTYNRIEMIHSLIKTAHETSTAIMQARHPDLIMQGLQQRKDYITGKSLTPRPKKAPEGALPQ